MLMNSRGPGEGGFMKRSCFEAVFMFTGFICSVFCAVVRFGALQIFVTIIYSNINLHNTNVLSNLLCKYEYKKIVNRDLFVLF